MNISLDGYPYFVFILDLDEHFLETIGLAVSFFREFFSLSDSSGDLGIRIQNEVDSFFDLGLIVGLVPG